MWKSQIVQLYIFIVTCQKIKFQALKVTQIIRTDISCWCYAIVNYIINYRYIYRQGYSQRTEHFKMMYSSVTKYHTNIWWG